MHLSLTTSLLTLNPIGISGAHLVTYSFALAAVMWIVAGVVALLEGRRMESQPVRRRAA
jgi:hypothetical protein